MPLCHDIKIEYENLQNVKDEYLSEWNKDENARDYTLLKKLKAKWERAYEKLESLLPVSLDRAKEIMGVERVLGPEEVKQVFGIDIEEIPPIPFPIEMLEKLKGTCRLILYADKFQDSSPVTAKAIAEKFDNKKADGSEQLLHDMGWYKNEEFFTKDTPKLRWRIVSDEVIQGSTDKNYLEQTERLANHIESLYDDKDAMPQDIKDMIAETRNLARDTDFRQAVESNDETFWKPAAEKLANLPLNQHFRESFVELIYRLALTDRARAEQLLKSVYSLTNSCSSVGWLVDGGEFDGGGVGVGVGAPGRRSSSLGCAFSAEKL